MLDEGLLWAEHVEEEGLDEYFFEKFKVVSEQSPR
jgi:hypothetical protein